VKRLEIIHLRLAGALPPGLVDEIRRSADGRDPAFVGLYRRANVDNDIAIHLHLNGPGPDDQASDLGLRLAAALKEYGMVEHTVWHAATPDERAEGGAER
jgi:hypothetical protein